LCRAAVVPLGELLAARAYARRLRGPQEAHEADPPAISRAVHGPLVARGSALAARARAAAIERVLRLAVAGSGQARDPARPDHLGREGFGVQAASAGPVARHAALGAGGRDSGGGALAARGGSAGGAGGAHAVRVDPRARGRHAVID